jgi:hypothetical protein
MTVTAAPLWVALGRSSPNEQEKESKKHALSVVRLMSLSAKFAERNQPASRNAN